MAIRIDAASEVLSRTTNLPSITAFTIMSWLKISVDRNDYCWWFKFGNTNSDPHYIIGVDDDGVTHLLWNGNAVSATGATFTVGTWFHNAVTVSGTGAGQFLSYINGVLNITHAGYASVAAQQIVLGDWETNASEWFNGCFSCLKIYDGVLSANEIATEMRSFMPVRVEGLNTWSPFLDAATAATNYAGLANWTTSGTLTTENGPPVPWTHNNRSYIFIPAGGGSVYTATLAGAVSAAGGVVKRVDKVLLGTSTPVGSLSKSAGKVLSGGVALSGVVVKQVGKVLSGAVGVVGALSISLQYALSLAGSINPVGVLVKRVEKVVSGAIVPVGSVTKRVDKILSGSVVVAGTVVKQINKILLGIIDGVGAITSDVIVGGGTLYEVTLAGAVAVSGVVTKQVNKVLVGVMTPVGVVVKVVGKVLQGSVVVSGSIRKVVEKVLSGVVTPIGVVVKVVMKSFVGVVTPVGVLTKSYVRRIVLSGVVTPVGALVSSVIAGSGVVLRTMYPLFRRKRR